MVGPPNIWKYFGISVIGPAHISAGLSNQDAWAGKISKKFTVVVVSDGLGSKKHSDVGSKAACTAVKTALKLWVSKQDAPVEVLLRLIHILWNLNIYPYDKNDCAATCLFSAAISDGRVISAKLGDGLIIVNHSDGSHYFLKCSDTDKFSNETTGLGIASSLDEWEWRTEHSASDIRSVMLTTDGISEDLLSDKLIEFNDFIFDEYRGLPPLKRRQKLLRELKDWPVPKHSDDKTLALLWRE